MSLFATEKWARLLRIMKQHGGLIGIMNSLWRTDTAKEGRLVGIDCLGNKYYENKYYMIGRSRWVVYHPMVKFEYDASMVTADWFGWLHYKTDHLPCDDPAKYCLNCCGWYHCWLLPHEENMSGTYLAFYPYNTTNQSMYVWDGTSICDKPQGTPRICSG